MFEKQSRNHKVMQKGYNLRRISEVLAGLSAKGLYFGPKLSPPPPQENVIFTLPAIINTSFSRTFFAFLYPNLNLLNPYTIHPFTFKSFYSFFWPFPLFISFHIPPQ
jgi:hypothetical protein